MNPHFSASHPSLRLFVLSVALGFALVCHTNSAQAQAEDEICFPPATWVPGLTGPPNWVSSSDPQYPKLDDPRWRGALRRGYPEASSTTSANVRGLYDGTHLYLSMRVNANLDSAITASDRIYVGLANTSTSTQHLFRITLNDSPSAGDAQNSIATAGYRSKSGSATSWGSVDPDAPEAAALDRVRTWIGPTTANPTAAWAVNFRINLSTLGISGNFRFWYAVTNTDAMDPVSVETYTWPRDTPGVSGWANGLDPAPSDDSAVVNNIASADWADARLGTTSSPCNDWISIHSGQIGTTNSPTSEIRTDMGNTFRADPTYNGYSASDLPPIVAKFRLAAWGTETTDRPDAAWEPLICTGASKCQGDGVSVQRTATNDGLIEFSCKKPGDSGSAPDCPEYDSSTMDDHQCMLVELSGGANFSQDSAYRNMDFVPASEFSRIATISLRGLGNKPGPKKPRDVYLYVRRLNMPAHGEVQLKLPREQMLATQRGLSAPIPAGITEKQGKALMAKKERSRDEQALLEVGTGNTPYEDMVSVWPTYEVHAFYDSGATMGFDGENRRHLVPMVPFGYHISHAGELYGFSDELTGALGTEVTKINANLYVLKVKDGEVAHVRTTIRAHEKPRSGDAPDGQDSQGCKCKGCCNPPVKVLIQPRCMCELGRAEPALAWLYGSLGLMLPGALFWFRRRRTKH